MDDTQVKPTAMESEPAAVRLLLEMDDAFNQCIADVTPKLAELEALARDLQGDQRRALYVTLYQYCDALRDTRHHLGERKDQGALLKVMASIKQQVEKHSAGRDLDTLLEEIPQVLQRSPHHHHCLATSKIFLAIHLLKVGWSVIPDGPRAAVIEKLNLSIALRNRIVGPWERTHGLIWGLEPYRSSCHLVALLLNMKCHACQRVWTATSGTDVDTLMPAQCLYCQSPDISRVPYNLHDFLTGVEGRPDAAPLWCYTAWTRLRRLLCCLGSSQQGCGSGGGRHDA